MDVLLLSQNGMLTGPHDSMVPFDLGILNNLVPWLRESIFPANNIALKCFLAIGGVILLYNIVRWFLG